MPSKVLIASTLFLVSMTTFATCPAIQSGHGVVPQNGAAAQVILPCGYADTNYSIAVTSTTNQGTFSAVLKSKSAFTAQLTSGNARFNIPFDWIAVQN